MQADSVVVRRLKRGREDEGGDEEGEELRGKLLGSPEGSLEVLFSR